MTTIIARPKRSIQLPLLKEAALALAARQGQATTPAPGVSVTEVQLTTLSFYLWPLGARTALELWDDTRGGNKVLNMNWDANGTIEVLSFRRGDWEMVLLRAARGALH